MDSSIIINTKGGVYIDDGEKIYNKPAKKISSGIDFFVMQDKTLMGYKSNVNGQLGYLQDIDDNYTYNVIPIYNGINDVVSIHCGGFHTIIRTKNFLYGSGDNRYGQLCLNDTIDRHEPTIINLTEFTINDIIQISCGQYHTMFLTTKGLYGYGRDSYVYQSGAQKLNTDYPINTIESIVCKGSFTIIKRIINEIYVGIDGYNGLMENDLDAFHYIYKL